MSNYFFNSDEFRVVHDQTSITTVFVFVFPLGVFVASEDDLFGIQ